MAGTGEMSLEKISNGRIDFGTPETLKSTEDGLGTATPHMLITAEIYESFYSLRGFSGAGFSIVKRMGTITLEIQTDEMAEARTSCTKNHETLY